MTSHFIQKRYSKKMHKILLWPSVLLKEIAISLKDLTRGFWFDTACGD